MNQAASIQERGLFKAPLATPGKPLDFSPILHERLVKVLAQLALPQASNRPSMLAKT